MVAIDALRITFASVQLSMHQLQASAAHAYTLGTVDHWLAVLKVASN